MDPPPRSAVPQQLGPAEPAYDAASLARAAGGILLRAGRHPIRGAAVDSRRVEPGQAFVALPGERTDGQGFLDQAVAAGGAALIVREAPPTAVLDALTRDGAVTVVQVADGLAALQAMAADWRARFAPLVVGITGSLGKTTTKEATAAVLRTARRTLASPGNENNEVGLPLTILRLRPEHEAAVLEMGMYVEGEIAQLAALARPRIGVVTAVRGVHLARAGSLAAIEREKGRLVEALPAEGTAVLNTDDPRVSRMAGRTRARVVRYGFDPTADVGAERVVAAGAEGMRFVLRAAGRRRPLAVPALGRPAVEAALAAAAVGLAAGLDPEAVAAGLEGGWGAAHRAELLRGGPWLIVDDTYNAAPDSAAAALDLLASLPGRHVAVLGDMLELGPAEAREHRRLGRRAAEAADLLVAVGPAMAGAAQAARRAGLAAAAVYEVPDAEAAAALVEPLLRPGDAILVKGSRALALERIVERLRAAGPGAATDQGAGSAASAGEEAGR
ncbi:MAG TPA: UDP-N-acetylmuramoyl-tripeptide--D-alanyl-D-alanine ligase [Candidatus Limnocylindrales bacterium]|nr:UDP-N-acetylmuramoyl-tripeptide--D-alanyl-D-alanine ligase [Candidatus Limnocylindrales bacterium]